MPRKLTGKSVQVPGLQEVFNDPCFCPSQDPFSYDIAEAVLGPTTKLMAQSANKYRDHIPHICYDRPFPEGSRLPGLNDAEIVFSPSATVAGLSQYFWKLEQPAHSMANGYFMACSNRAGTGAPWNIGRFYGSSYFVDPRGNLIAMGSEDKDELVVAEMDLDVIEACAVYGRSIATAVPRPHGSMTEELP